MKNVESLIQAALCPDYTRGQRHHAFGQLVEQFQGEIYGRAYRILKDVQLAQDATQETFIAAYQHLAQLRQADAFSAWLHQILRTQCNRIHRKKTWPIFPLEAHHEVDSSELDPAVVVESYDVRATVLAAIETLPEHERVVVQLFYLQDFSLKEVADRLKVPLTTVKKRLQYAREHLRERMERIERGLFQCQVAFEESKRRLLEITLFPLAPALISCPVWVHNRQHLPLRSGPHDG